MSGDRSYPARDERFASDRERPFWDLAALLRPGDAPRLADLGCGTGRLTAELGGTARGARDARGRQLARDARAGRRPRRPGREVRARLHRDLAAPGAFDVVFSDAALDWVPDHPAVLTRWAASLAPGGQLAAQLPDNRRSRPHRLAAELAGEAIPHTILDIDEYSRLLDDLGFTEQHVRAQAYPPGCRRATRRSTGCAARA